MKNIEIPRIKTEGAVMRKQNRSYYIKNERGETMKVLAVINMQEDSVIYKEEKTGETKECTLMEFLELKEYEMDVLKNLKGER